VFGGHPHPEVPQFSEQIVEEVTIVSCKNLTYAFHLQLGLNLLDREEANAFDDWHLTCQACNNKTDKFCLHLDIIDQFFSEQSRQISQNIQIKAGIVLFVNHELCLESYFADKVDDWISERLCNIQVRNQVNEGTLLLQTNTRLLDHLAKLFLP